MEFLKNIRTRIGEYLLLRQEEGYSRSRAIMNIDSAHSIGIIYCADEPGDVEFIKNYIQSIRNKGKQVKSLGFIHTKELPPDINGSIMHQYFALKELNWYFKPSSQFIDNFVNDEFDILMDFGLSEQLPIMFISSMSKAKCKVGRYLKKYAELYDVMIEAGENKKLEYVVNTTHSYMMLLNKK